MSLPASTWSGASVRYYGEHKQTLLSVVNLRERKMLGAPLQWVRRLVVPPSWAINHCRRREGTYFIESLSKSLSPRKEPGKQNQGQLGSCAGSPRLDLALRYRANCLRRKRFSAARVQRG